MLVYDKQQRGEIDVTPQEAVTGVAQGLYIVENRVHQIVDDSGEVGEATPGELPRWFAEGYRFATDEDISRYQQGDSALRAGAEAAVNSATFGALNIGTQFAESQGLIDPGASEEMRFRREENPKSAMAGALLPTLLAGPAGALKGAGMLARGARAATALPRLTQRAGLQAGAASMRAMKAAGVSGGLPAQAVKLATQEAVEGAGYGFTQSFSELDLGDPDQIAEQIIAGTGVGLLSGALLGGAMAPLAKGFRAGRGSVARGLSRMAENASGAPSHKKLGGVLQDMYHQGLLKAQKAVRPGQAETIDKFFRNRKNLGDVDLVENTAVGLRKSLDELSKLDDEMLRTGLVGAKMGNIGKSIDSSPEQQAEAIAWAQGMIEGAFDTGHKVGGPAGRRLKTLAGEMQMSMFGKGAAAAFEAVDKLKREMDFMLNPSGIAKRQASAGHVSMERLEQEDMLKQMADAARAGLEDVKLWGTAGSTQAQTNAILSERMRTGGNFKAQFMKAQDGGTRYISDQDKIMAFLKNTTGGKNDLRFATLNKELYDIRRGIQLERAMYDPTPAREKLLAKLDNLASRVEREIGDKHALIGLQNQAKAMAQGAKSGPVAQILQNKILRTGVGYAQGGGAGVAVTHAVGAAADAVFDSGQYYLNFGRAAQTAEAATKAVKGKVRQFLAVAAEKGRAAAPLVRSVRTPLLAEMVMGEAKERNAAYQEARHAVEVAARNPSLTNDQVLEAMGPMADFAPNLASAISTRLVKNAGWLTDNLPQETVSPTMFGETLNLSDMEMQRAYQMLFVSEDPFRVVDLLAEGRLTITDVQAYKAMWPHMYEQTRAAIIEELEDPEIRASLSYQKRIQLGILFELATDPSMMPEQILLAQQANRQITAPAEEPDEGGGAGEFSAKAIAGVSKEATTMDQSALRER